jgi:hypothetical protein
MKGTYNQPTNAHCHIKSTHQTIKW